MVWARIDDEILDNEKITNARALGFALYVASITWSCRNLTDGFVPRSKIRALLDFEGLAFVRSDGGLSGEVRPVDALDVAEECVVAGLFIEDEERRGFWIHDFLDFNPPKEKVLAERARGRERAKVSADKRKSDPPFPAANPKASPEAPPKLRTESASASHGPVPVPVPVPQREDSSTLLPITAPQLTLAVPAPKVSTVEVGNDHDPPSDPPPKRSRGSRLPPGWMPSKVTQEWARKEGVAEPCGRVLEEFRDFWAGMPGARGVKQDWEATYRNRIRQVAERQPQSSRARGSGGGPRGDRQGLPSGPLPWLPTGTDPNPFGDDP